MGTIDQAHGVTRAQAPVSSLLHGAAENPPCVDDRARADRASASRQRPPEELVLEALNVLWRELRELHVAKPRYQILANDRSVTPEATRPELGFGHVLQPVDQELPDGLTLRPQGQAKLGAAFKFGK